MQEWSDHILQSLLFGLLKELQRNGLLSFNLVNEAICGSPTVVNHIGSQNQLRSSSQNPTHVVYLVFAVENCIEMIK
jgi:hypothetical protein